MRERPKLIQEDYVETDHGPWKVLVICLCLNMAAWPVAELVVQEIFELYPDPVDLDEVSLDPRNESYERLMGVMRCLGFGRKRITYLVEMSRQYVRYRELFGTKFHLYRVKEFRGCGRYACDAWTLFVLKRSCIPTDRHLKRYAVREGLIDEPT